MKYRFSFDNQNTVYLKFSNEMSKSPGEGILCTYVHPYQKINIGHVKMKIPISYQKGDFLIVKLYSIYFLDAVSALSKRNDNKVDGLKLSNTRGLIAQNWFCAIAAYRTKQFCTMFCTMCLPKERFLLHTTLDFILTRAA